MAKVCGNYLQVVAKDMLENQAGLGIRVPPFASLCEITGTHPK